MCAFGVNEEVIEIFGKGRNPHMGQVFRMHRAHLNWLLARFNLDSGNSIHQVDANQQVADMTTKGSLEREKLNQLTFSFQSRAS